MPDREAAAAFYAELFGWERRADRFLQDGYDVAGVHEAERAQWLSFVSVREAGATAARGG